jgi:hypothetical protein
MIYNKLYNLLLLEEALVAHHAKQHLQQQLQLYAI